MDQVRQVMKTVAEFYQRVRERFSPISQSADRWHHRRWGDSLDEGFESPWFEALADALNAEMQREVPFETHEPLFRFIEGAFLQGTEEVRKCIDVSFVENLFWQVPSRKCVAYWEPLPAELRRLYLEFHRREP